jgi:beta-lactamase superfamily II metal-dependent hydrolase
VLLATFGILAMTRPLQNVLFRLTGNGLVREWLLLPLAVSAAAQVATAPVIAYHFHRIPMISLLANLVVVPLTNLLLAIGLCMALIGILWLPLIKPLAACAYVISWLSLKAVSLFAMVRFGTILWPHPGALQVLLYSVLVVLAFRWRGAGRLRPALLAMALVLLTVQVWQLAAVRPHGLRVTFLDVGQGDAALVEFPNGKRLLIDAGPATPGYDAGERAIVPFLRGGGLLSLDEVLISHGDADHCGGLPYLLARIKTKRLLIAAYQPPQSLFNQGIAAALARGVAIDTIRGYDTLDGIWPCRGFPGRRQRGFAGGRDPMRCPHVPLHRRHGAGTRAVAAATGNARPLHGAEGAASRFADQQYARGDRPAAAGAERDLGR